VVLLLIVIRYGGVSPEFAARNRPFLQNTPLAAVRDGIDRTEFVKDYEKTGGRPAYEEEVAALVGLLCLPDAGFTTGSVLCANGGMKFVH
jgi:NAD(P)-dependent dehydrogenase (short-subunit alcohol dehydrogenase family)